MTPANMMKKLIKRKMEKEGIRNSLLARKVGMDHANLSRTLRSNVSNDASFNNLIRIMAALEIDFSLLDMICIEEKHDKAG